jgi:hypothetical protein
MENPMHKRAMQKTAQDAMKKINKMIVEKAMREICDARGIIPAANNCPKRMEE